MPLSTESSPRSHDNNGTAPRTRRRDPNAEAIAIVMRFAERLEVAQSLVRIVSGIAQQHAAVYAAQASERVRTSPMTEHVDQARRLVQAATQAAIHAATQAVARHVDDDAEGEGAAEPSKATEQELLDHETLHDDAC
jgi:hypothetical protein